MQLTCASGLHSPCLAQPLLGRRLANLADTKARLAGCSQQSAACIEAVRKEVDDHAALVTGLVADLLQIHRKARHARARSAQVQLSAALGC